MFKSPPQEKQWLSWTYVVIWTSIIFVTIPLARTIRKFVYQEWNRDLFTYVVLAITVLAFVAAIIYIRRIRLASRSSYVWLAAIASIFFVYTIELGKQNPEEAIHFVQYGLLGILVYRALASQLHDISIFFFLRQRSSVALSAHLINLFSGLHLRGFGGCATFG